MIEKCRGRDVVKGKGGRNDVDEKNETGDDVGEEREVNEEEL